MTSANKSVWLNKRMSESTLWFLFLTLVVLCSHISSACTSTVVSSPWTLFYFPGVLNAVMWCNSTLLVSQFPHKLLMIKNRWKFIHSIIFSLTFILGVWLSMGLYINVMIKTRPGTTVVLLLLLVHLVMETVSITLYSIILSSHLVL